MDRDERSTKPDPLDYQAYELGLAAEALWLAALGLRSHARDHTITDTELEALEAAALDVAHRARTLKGQIDDVLETSPAPPAATELRAAAAALLEDLEAFHEGHVHRDRRRAIARLRRAVATERGASS